MLGGGTNADIFWIRRSHKQEHLLHSWVPVLVLVHAVPQPINKHHGVLHRPSLCFRDWGGGGLFMGEAQKGLAISDISLSVITCRDFDL